VVNICFRLWV